LLALPDSVRPTAKASWQWLRERRFRFLDFCHFPLWLAWMCARHRNRAVILSRIAALGDVICTLPMCEVLCKKHPGKVLIFVTSRDYMPMVRLAREPAIFYGARSWSWSFSFLRKLRFFGLVEALYEPKTSDERSKNGSKCHLMEDLADSCGIVLSNPRPRLYPADELVRNVRSKYGFSDQVAQGRLIVGLNCGQVWRVRSWSPEKWQVLLDRLHAEYDATVLQFVFRKGERDEYDGLRGIDFEIRMMMDKDELVALVANCHLLISVDSGPVHIAGALGIPVVGLYGALSPDNFLPRVSPATGVHSDVSCLFCQHASPVGHWKSGCPNDIRCMKELEVEPVFKAVKAMIAQLGLASSKLATGPQSGA
jgi:ADP-heptose:LPS heptosyltransferase